MDDEENVWFQNTIPQNMFLSLACSEETSNLINHISSTVNAIDDFAKNKFRQNRIEIQLRFLISNLFYVYLNKGMDGGIGVHLNKNTEIRGQRYNPQQIRPYYQSPIIDAFVEARLITKQNHFYNGSIGRCTKIQITEDLISLISNFGVESRHIIAINSPTVQVKRKKKEHKVGRDGLLMTYNSTIPIDFDESEDTTKWGEMISDYRVLLIRHKIELPIGTPESFNLMEMLEVDKLLIYRVFTIKEKEELRFDVIGRIIGCWQPIRSTLRPFIKFDSENTVELDFNSMATTQLYVRYELPLPNDDCYALEQYDSKFRPVIKKVMNTAINSSNIKQSLRRLLDTAYGFDNNPDLHPLIRELGNSVDCLLEINLALRHKHSQISESLGTGIGRELMFGESEIAMKVIDKFVAEDRPILSIHDSFVVCESDRNLAEETMIEAFYEVYPQAKNTIPRDRLVSIK